MQTINELEVYVTESGLGRASIIKRADGLFCLYVHWLWDEKTHKIFRVVDRGPEDWRDGSITKFELYSDNEPEPGLYGQVEDARNAIRSIPGFSDAVKI